MPLANSKLFDDDVFYALFLLKKSTIMLKYLLISIPEDILKHSFLLQKFLK